MGIRCPGKGRLGAASHQGKIPGFRPLACIQATRTPGAAAGPSRVELNHRNFGNCGCWSGREDSNLRPPEPHSGALPSCATPRKQPNQGAMIPQPQTKGFGSGLTYGYLVEVPSNVKPFFDETAKSPFRLAPDALTDRIRVRHYARALRLPGTSTLASLSRARSE